MLRQFFICIALCASLISPAGAAEQPMTAAEIEAALMGNSIDGVWAGTKYRQYYDKARFTMYVPEGGKASPGKWRVNPATDAYESWWENTGWTPYKMSRDGDTYYWLTSEKEYPFVILKGKQVDW